MSFIFGLQAVWVGRANILRRENVHFCPHKMTGRICGSEKTPKSSSGGVFFVPMKYSLSILSFVLFGHFLWQRKNDVKEKQK